MQTYVARRSLLSNDTAACIAASPTLMRQLMQYLTLALQTGILARHAPLRQARVRDRLVGVSSWSNVNPYASLTIIPSLPRPPSACTASQTAPCRCSTSSRTVRTTGSSLVLSSPALSMVPGLALRPSKEPCKMIALSCSLAQAYGLYVSATPKVRVSAFAL